MRIISTFLSAACLVMLLGFTTPVAKASLWNKKTVVTFNEPVEIPGHVLLPGTAYTFKLMNSDSDRNIVEVTSQHGTQLVAVLLTDSADRVNIQPKATFQFEKRGLGSPEAIENWFYPADNIGVHFNYLKSNHPSGPSATPQSGS